MAQLNFNAATVAPSAPLIPVPPADYLCTITETEIRPTKSGEGTALAITFQIADGEFKNRKLWANLNIQNKNATAMEIAQKDLSAICHAVGVIDLQDTVQLHDRPIVLSVGIQPATAQYEASNRIKGYKAYGGAGPSSAPTMAPAAPTMAPAAAPVYAFGGYAHGGPVAHPAQDQFQQAPPQAPVYQTAPPVAQAAPQGPFQQAPAAQQGQFQLPPSQPATAFAPPAPPFQQAPAAQPPAAQPPVQQAEATAPVSQAPEAGATPPWARPAT